MNSEIYFAEITQISIFSIRVIHVMFQDIREHIDIQDIREDKNFVFGTIKKHTHKYLFPAFKIMLPCP